MNWLNGVQKLALKSQLYVSLCATLLEIFILKEENAYQSSLVVVVFLTFWNGYLFTVFRKKKLTFLWSTIGFALISLLILTSLNLEFYLKWLVVLAFGMVYNADKVREFSLIKTFYVGGVWAATLVFLPLQNIHWDWFFIVFLFVSGITFPFEIRDMERDQFPTLPKVLGILNTKILSVVFLASIALLAYLYLDPSFSAAWMISTLVSIILVLFSGRKRKHEYYSFFMESLSAMPIFIYFILNLKNQIKP